MKLLLDENLPKRLKEDFPEHQVFTVRDLGWQGKKDGEILSLLRDNDFDVMLTFDKNLRYQQNLVKTEIRLIVLSASNNTYLVLTRLSIKIKEILNQKVSSQNVFVINEDLKSPLTL